MNGLGVETCLLHDVRSDGVAGLRPGLCFGAEPDEDPQIFDGASWWGSGILLPLGTWKTLLLLLRLLMVVVSYSGGSRGAGVGRWACGDAAVCRFGCGKGLIPEVQEACCEVSGKLPFRLSRELPCGFFEGCTKGSEDG
jgi:hypothetical protein